MAGECVTFLQKQLPFENDAKLRKRDRITKEPTEQFTAKDMNEISA
jgi:hypothetical protein